MDNEDPRTIVYDKVKWHTEKGAPLKHVMNYFELVMDFLAAHNMLSKEGNEVYLDGINTDSSIYSDLLNKAGNEFMTQHYNDWLKSFEDYQDIKDTVLLEKYLSHEE